MAPSSHARPRAILLLLVVVLLAGIGAGRGAAATVTVAPGETLSGIAARHGVSATALAAANGITNPNLVVAGSRLRLPVGSGATATATAPSMGTVTVRAGDTLSVIAARAGVGVSALATLNGLADPNAVRTGQVLRLPAATSAASTAPSYIAPTVTVPRGEVGALISRTAARYGVDAGLARAIAWQESGFSQHMRSHAGAIGVMQLMPYTADWIGPAVVGRRLDARNVHDNIEGGVAFLAWLQRRTGDSRRTAMAYYQGLASLNERGPYDDTLAYAKSVMALAGRV